MKKIAIVGGGISGIVLSSLLKKFLNYDIQIFERYELSESVNGIQISPNGNKILDMLDFSEMQNQYIQISKINFFDLKNKSYISSMKLDYDANSKYITLNRTELLKFLINKYRLSENINNKTVIEVSEKNSSIILSDKSEIYFDYIIIADGIFSKLRPNFIKAIYSRFTAYRGTYETNIQRHDVDVHMGDDFHLVSYPINEKKMNSFTLVNKETNEKIINNYNFEASTFKDDFISKIPPSHNDVFKSNNVKLWPIYKLNKIYFGNKNIFYIGDSAHGFIPSRAQGASQAIEDAYAIYKLLNKNNLTHEKFIKLRKIRIKKIIKKSENNLFIFHQSFFLIRLFRNLFIKIICSSKGLTKKFNSYIFDFKLN